VPASIVTSAAVNPRRAQVENDVAEQALPAAAGGDAPRSRAPHVAEQRRRVARHHDPMAGDRADGQRQIGGQPLQFATRDRLRRAVDAVRELLEAQSSSLGGRVAQQLGCALTFGVRGAHARRSSAGPGTGRGPLRRVVLR
jgi:hypothetical protein